VVIPAFREATVIGEVVTGLRAAGWRVVVVDDGSTDATAVEAQRAGAVVLRHVVNLGQGAALRTGFAFTLRQPGTRVVVTFDADGQHAPADVAEVVSPLADGRADVVLGSRFLHPDALRRIPSLRRSLLRLATAMARRTTGLPLTDTHNGLRGFTVAALARLRLSQDRMAHASEILTEVSRTGCTVLEVPADISYTPYSLTKGQRLIDAATILWDLAISRLR
jgi:glycosyltransferase involved in cell wall biosynthesis